MQHLSSSNTEASLREKKMDKMLVKNEVNSNGRRSRSVAKNSSDGIRAIKCIKRRRREPPLSVTVKNINAEVIDQSSASSTTKRSSRFRGVSKHRWTGRFEAHLWDKSSWNETQRKKGKQVYLGAYNEEEAAARAYDLAALKYWGPTTNTNFPVSEYEKELQIMQNLTKEEYLASLRRKSSGFSRGVSKYRGVARHHHNGRWEARIGRVFGNKYLYLGTYSTQEEAAHAYDIAAIEYRGINAVTNFDLSTYIRWLKPGASTVTNSVQDHHANTEYQVVQALTDNFPTTEHENLLNHNPLLLDGIISPCKQEFVPLQFSGSGFSIKSSPTALSLLLKSTMFRQLVERNSDAADSEEQENTNDQRVHLGSVVEEGRISYEGIPCVPYVCSSTRHSAQNIKLQDSDSYYDSREQLLWNGIVSMSTLQ